MKLNGRRGEVYFHILQNENCTLRYQDNRKVEVGKVLKASKRAHSKTWGTYTDKEFYNKPMMCQYGMHASKNIWDAMKYVAPASERYVCLVRLHDKVEHGDDKSVALRRECIAMRQVEIGNSFELFLRDAVDRLQRAYGTSFERRKIIENCPLSHVAFRINFLEESMNQAVAAWIENHIDSPILRKKLEDIKP